MRLRLFLFCLVASLPALGAAQADNDPFELSFEELMRLEVVSVSKRAESQFTVPAAVHVVTREHIARIGATSLGEALRGVPGLHVRGSTIAPGPSPAEASTVRLPTNSLCW